MFKRGYENGEQAIEIYEGKVDLILYNEDAKSPTFYYYRFNSKDVLGEKLKREVSLVHKVDVEKFLKMRGMNYGALIEELLQKAWEGNMNPKYDM